MRKFVVSLIASGAVLATGIATNPVTAAPLPASAAMLQDAALAHGRVILVGLRYLYGSRYYPPYYQRYKRYGPYYSGYRGYRPYYAPLSICGTMLCYRPKYFIAPLCPEPGVARGDHRCGVAMPPCGRQQDTTLQHALSPSRSRTGEMLGPRVSRPADGPLRPGTKLLWARPDR